MLESPYLCLIEDMKLSSTVEKAWMNHKSSWQGILRFSIPMDQKSNNPQEQEPSFRIKTRNCLFLWDNSQDEVYWVINERLKDAVCGSSIGNRLNSICRFNTIELLWIPGHCDIEENGVSDALVKEGPISPMPELGQRTLDTNFQGHWVILTRSSQTEYFFAITFVCFKNSNSTDFRAIESDENPSWTTTPKLWFFD